MRHIKKITAFTIIVLSLFTMTLSALAETYSVAPGATKKSINYAKPSTGIAKASITVNLNSAGDKVTVWIDCWDTAHPTDGNDGSWRYRESVTFTSSGTKTISWTMKSSERTFRIRIVAAGTNSGNASVFIYPL